MLNRVNPRRFYDIQRKVEAMCARDTELKASSQRCFIGYLKYVFMQKNKNVFQIEKVDLDLYARSLGLVVTPRARFLHKYFASKGINMTNEPVRIPEAVHILINFSNCAVSLCRIFSYG